MGYDVKQLRARIKSVDSTLHLTTAMGLVASSKVRRSNEKMRSGREYRASVQNVIEGLTCIPECRSNNYMRDTGDRTAVIVIAGDRGMAGGYNANVFRALSQYPSANLIPIGKRVCDRFRKETVSSEHFDYAAARELSFRLCESFLNNEFDKLMIVYTRYVSTMTQEPVSEQILPLCKGTAVKGDDLLFEPDANSLLENIVPNYVASVIISAVYESYACEVAARRTAMDSAGKNARQMIDDLTLSYNRARQASITQEITEIVAGSGR